MAIPADVLKKAKDAVAHSETTEQIRAYGYSDVAIAEFSGPPDMSRNYEPITDEVRKQAMDAVSHKETMAQIKLVVNNESFSPGPTPSPKSAAMAERIAEKYKSGQDVDSIHSDITRDNFGREREV